MTHSTPRTPGLFPRVLPMRERAEMIYRNLKDRLETILPLAMRENGIDCWLIVCQEDNPDPVFASMLPLDTWTPILQIFAFFDRGEAGIERLNISGAPTRDLYERPYLGQLEDEQWATLLRFLEERNPQRIGLNIGRIAWAAGGLTWNLHQQLHERLPSKYHGRFVSAEPAGTRWLETLTGGELKHYAHVTQVAHAVIADCFSPCAVNPGVTTAEDLRWHYWQTCADRGLDVAFLPYFTLRRGPQNRARFGPDDKIIRRGDFVHCDVGLKYLGLVSDHQEWLYVRRESETAAPESFRQLLRENNRLQVIFLDEFKLGRTGNQLLERMLARAKQEGVPEPMIYSHSLGRLLHEPGPLIGLPWEQERCPGRGDVPLVHNSCFTMELSVGGVIPEWNNEKFRLGTEQDVMFTKDGGCQVLDGRQTDFHLI